MSETPKRKPRGFFATDQGRKILEQRRQEKGYTYETLAEQAKVGVDQVKRLAKPQWGYRVQRDAIKKIARLLELEPTDIVDTNEWFYCPPQKNLKLGQKYRYKSRILIPLELEEISEVFLADLSELLRKHGWVN